MKRVFTWQGYVTSVMWKFNIKGFICMCLHLTSLLSSFNLLKAYVNFQCFHCLWNKRTSLEKIKGPSLIFIDWTPMLDFRTVGPILLRGDRSFMLKSWYWYLYDNNTQYMKILVGKTKIEKTFLRAALACLYRVDSKSAFHWSRI